MTGTCRQSAGGSRARGRRCDRRRRAPRADIHGRPVLDRSRGHGAQRPDEGDPARRGTRPIGRNGTVPGEHGAVSRGLCPPGSSKVWSCLEGPWPLRNAVRAEDMPPPLAAAAEAKADDLREALARAEEAAAGLRSEDELPATNSVSPGRSRVPRSARTEQLADLAVLRMRQRAISRAEPAKAQALRELVLEHGFNAPPESPEPPNGVWASARTGSGLLLRTSLLRLSRRESEPSRRPLRLAQAPSAPEGQTPVAAVPDVARSPARNLTCGHRLLR